MCDPRQMRMKKFTILFFITLFAYGQQEKGSFSIESVFNESTMVFSGQVIDKESYWDVEHKMIYTVHKVKLAKSYKGSFEQYTFLISEGGTIGLQGIIVKPSVKFRINSTGYFLLKEASSIFLDGFSGDNELMELTNTSFGFLPYNIYDDSVQITDDLRITPKNFEKKLKKISKKKPTITNPIFNEQIFSSSFSLANSEISSISPTTIIAGNKEVLTINGNGFGEFLSGDSYGKVLFKNADDGGSTWLSSIKTQIVSWSDTEIKVEVPSDCGSGLLRVQTASDKIIESNQEIDIPYSLNSLTYPSDGEPDEIYEYPIYHTGNIKEDILDADDEYLDHIYDGRYFLTLNSDFSLIDDARAQFDFALTDWVCRSGINFELTEETSSIDSAKKDNTNIVSFGNTNALGVTYMYFDGCVITDSEENIVDVQIAYTEIDIIFNNVVQWGYDEVSNSQYDFKSTAKHEIGHALGFGHNINEYSLMHYASPRGMGTTSIDSYLSGTNIINNRDTSTSLCDVLSPHQVSECSSIDYELDSDNDGVNDIYDRCPETEFTQSVDLFGCAPYQLDSDNDGVFDDLDQCNSTPQDAIVNDFGCADIDGDGVSEFSDLCPETPLGSEVDENGCSLSQKDTDQDGVTDNFDQCPFTPSETKVDAYGCSLFSLPEDNYQIIINSLSCINSNDGSITIGVNNNNFDYNVEINDSLYNLNESNDHELSIKNLNSDSYLICFTIDGVESYEQCYQVQINQPEPLSVSYSFINLGKSILFRVNGSDYFNVIHNEKNYSIQGNEVELFLENGSNYVKIDTDLNCQGYFQEYFIMDQKQFHLYPSIFHDEITLVSNMISSNSSLIVFDIQGNIVFNKDISLVEGSKINLSLGYLSKGVYLFKFINNDRQEVHKIIKYE